MTDSFTAWLSEQARAREASGLQRTLRPASATTGGLVDLAGNDYLGLARDPRLARAAAEAAARYGAGAGASRLVSGTLAVHERVEAALANFTLAPSALVTSTGYHANLAVVTALAGADTLIVSDAHVHASLVDACRLSRGATVYVAPHSDPEAVAAALASRSQRRALVLCESIYSVFGDAAPLEELASVCEANDALLLIDEAHGLGVAGHGGRGLAHAAGLSGRDDVVITATLSKALGSQGGAILASTQVRDQVINRGRPFIYDTGLAPAAAGAAAEALDIVASEPQLAALARAAAHRLADAIGAAAPAGAVLSLPLPGPRQAVAAVASCEAAGLRVGCFRPPSTPDGTSRLRMTANAALTDAELARAAGVLRAVVAQHQGTR